ncbi:MAG: histidine kinase [Bacteroidota bacterium]
MNPDSAYTKPRIIAIITSWLYRYRVHLIAWTCFILNEVLAARFVAGRFGPPANYLVHYTINIAFFYINAHYLLPRAFAIRSSIYLRFPLAVLSGLALYLGASYLSDHLLSYFTTHQFGGKYLRVTQYFLFTTMWRGIYFLGFSTGYYFIRAYLKSKLAEEQAERKILLQLIREKESTIQLSQAKNAYLQAQINPHFLFNSFNFIYSKSRKSDPQTAQAVMLLTKIMRYLLESNHGNGRIRIEEEVAQLRNLITFWELREGIPIPIAIQCDPLAAETLFIPLVLLTLTENMLIHGDLSSGETPAAIIIRQKDNTLEIRTQNASHPQQKTGGMNSGLKNISERLEYSYGQGAKLTYRRSADQNRFIVELTLKLQE